MNCNDAIEKHQKLLDKANDDDLQGLIKYIEEEIPQIEKYYSDKIFSMQNEIINRIISKKTNENYKTIFYILNNLLNHFGYTHRICIEIALLNVSHNIDMKAQLDFFKKIPPQINSDPIIRLITAETYRKLNDISKAISIYNNLPSKDGWWPFDALWDNLTYHLSCYLLDVNNKFILKQNKNSSGWNIEPYPFRALIAGLLHQSSNNPEDFRSQIEKVMWSTPIPYTDVGGLAISFLAAHIENLDSDKAAIAFQLAVAFNKIEEINTILKKEDYVLEKLYIHPLFIKYLDIISQKHECYRNLFDKYLYLFMNTEYSIKFRNGDLKSYTFSSLDKVSVWANEVFSRHREILENQKIPNMHFLEKGNHDIFPYKGGNNHIFIGIFGQIRDLLNDFPKVMRYLYNDTQHLRAINKKITIGISVWDNTGQKKIENGSPISEFIHRLPKVISSIISHYEINNLDDIKNILPRTAEAIQKSSYAFDLVSPESIFNVAQSCGFSTDEIVIDVSTEKKYLDDIGYKFREFYHNPSSGIENQARMWDRIAALYDLAKQSIEDTGVPIDVMALVRPDILFEDSSITKLALEVAAMEKPTVVSDYDPRACWIEGVGDRYFVGNPRGVARAFDAKNLIIQIIKDPVLSILYKDRPFWHRFAQTIFYESDNFLRDSSDIKMKFLRQKVDIEYIIPFLKEDYDKCTDENLRSIIGRYIPNI